MMLKDLLKNTLNACIVFAGDHVSELDGANVFRSGEQHSGSGESEGVL